MEQFWHCIFWFRFLIIFLTALCSATEARHCHRHHPCCGPCVWDLCEEKAECLFNNNANLTVTTEQLIANAKESKRCGCRGPKICPKKIKKLFAKIDTIKTKHPNLFPPKNSMAGTTTTRNSSRNRRKRDISEPFSDVLARQELFAAAAAGYGEKDAIKQCIQSIDQNSTVVDIIEVNCADKKNHKCLAYLAVAHTKQIIFVGFRGTNSFGQLLYEAFDTVFQNLVQMGNFGKIGHYFARIFTQFWVEAKMLLKVASLANQYPTYDIYVAGHSLGGALAAIAAVHIAQDIKSDKVRHVKLFTLGQPRTGDNTWSEYVDSTLNEFTYRVVNEHDLVVHLPISVPLFFFDDFWHHKTEIWYEQDMTCELSAIQFNQNGDYEIEGTPVVHQCANPDQDSTCSYGTFGYSKSNHLNYYGAQVSKFGINGCQLIRNQDKSGCKTDSQN